MLARVTRFLRLPARPRFRTRPRRGGGRAADRPRGPARPAGRAAPRAQGAAVRLPGRRPALRRAVRHALAAPRRAHGAGRRCGVGPRCASRGGARRRQAWACRTGSSAGAGEDAAPEGRRAGASAAESLAEVDLRHIADPDELAQVEALAERLAARLRLRLTRRHRLADRGAQPDLRRTIRRSLAHGGTPIEPAYRRRRVKPPRLVLLLDASGSMSQYSALFVRFLKGLLGTGQRTEAFVFHTRLVHVSPALRDRDAEPSGRAHEPDRARLARRHADRREPGRLQSQLRQAGRRPAHGGDRHERRLRHRSRRRAGRGAGNTASPRAPDPLAEPDAGLAGLRAQRAPGWRPPCPISTCSRRPTIWPASPRWNRSSPGCADRATACSTCWRSSRRARSLVPWRP